MSKKVIFEVTDEQAEKINKLWERSKNSKFTPSKSTTFEDFCKEVIVSCAEGPNFEDLLKDVDLNEVQNSFKELKERLNDLMGAYKDLSPKKEENKKDSDPNDKKYKS